MKQYRACIRWCGTCLLLLLLHASGFAQDTTILDTSFIAADTEVSVSTYDSYDQSPQQITAQEPAVFRAVPDSVITNLQRKKEFAYANDASLWEKKKTPVDDDGNWIDWLVMRRWFRYMIFILLAGVLLFALVRIAVSNRMVLFTRTKKSANAEEDELLQKENLDALIHEAEAQNNFRNAVRYRYMKVLQHMDERQIISLNAQSTNWDYVNRLGGHPLKNKFLLLTRAYEYVWYGEFEINPDQYGYLRTEFQQFENSLNR